MPGVSNPTLIQSSNSYRSSEALPLVLIHDGGGTVFSYHCLGPLGRKVYGISNPRINFERPWKGGIKKMCKLYAVLIQSVIPRGKFLLGGWSFGGAVSLEIAKNLAHTETKVAGILMVDSIWPGAMKSLGQKSWVPYAASMESTPSEMRVKVARCMKQAGEMLRDWDIPNFASWRPSKQKIQFAADSKHDSSSESSGRTSPSSYDSEGSSRSSSVSSHSGDYAVKPLHSLDLDMVRLNLLPRLPPILLLRCTDYVPVSPSHENDGICRVDVTRDMPCLGWTNHSLNTIALTKDINGHHFDIFTSQRVNNTTREIRLACEWLERCSDI